MALEIAYVRVVVGGEEADGIVDLGTGVDDALGMVTEARKVHAVFLTLQLFGVLALLAVVDLKRVIVACYNGKFARVVKVERCDGSALAARFEALGAVLACASFTDYKGIAHPLRPETRYDVANFLCRRACRRWRRPSAGRR